MPIKSPYSGVYIEELHSKMKTIKGVPTSITAFIGRATKGPKNKPIKITSFQDYERIFGGLSRKNELSYSVYYYFLNGGSYAIIIRVNSSSNDVSLKDEEIIGNREEKTGLYALENVEIFNMLCIPPCNKNETTSAQVYEKAAEYCENRRAILLVDPPKAWDTHHKPIDRKLGLGSAEFKLSRSPNATMFFPRLKAHDPLNQDEIRELVPSGAVAGVIARIDSARGVWKAPAGIETIIKGVSDLSIELRQNDYDKLQKVGINCLRLMSNNEVVIWGARTLIGAENLSSEWKYLPVRRFALYIEESLYRGTKWIVFEPNDEPLWSQIRLNIGTFMYNLFRQGALQGLTPKEAYFVKCDKETTTQDDIDRGAVNILVGFAPMKPAEFVILKIQLIAGQEIE